MRTTSQNASVPHKTYIHIHNYIALHNCLPKKKNTHTHHTTRNIFMSAPTLSPEPITVD